MAEETHYAKCRRLKRCISCPNPATKHARCDDCRKKRKEAHAALAKARKCVDCKKSHGESGVRCAGCKAEHVRLYNERKAIGVCPHDGKPSAGEPGTPCAECLITNRKKDRRKYAKLRREVLQAYGGDNPACACCGENTVQFLQIDHVNNDGGEHRRALSGKNQGCNIYTWLRKNDYPVGFQILCANCNSAKGFYGTCPHEARRQDRRVLDAYGGPVCVGCGEDCSEVLQVAHTGGGYRVLCPTCNVKAARGIALPREKLAEAQAAFYRENADDPYFEG